MLPKPRLRLTYANVVSTLCLFIVLGGTSYAVATGSIDSREIKDNSVRSKDLRNSGVRSKDVRNRSLLAKDFKFGQLPRGRRGPRGLRGPRGRRGRRGVAGATNVVLRTDGATAGAAAIDNAPCASGERAVGGGGRAVGGSIAVSAPTSVGNGSTPTDWRVEANGGTSAEAYVICSRP
jgi:hypothetical protein